MSDGSYLETLYEMRNQYRLNAEHAIKAKEYRKASELLWGAVTQQLKAFAATRGIAIGSHRQFFDFLRQLSSELNDKSVYVEFVALNALHQNFYDETIPSDIFPDFYNRAIEYIGRLDSLIPKR